MNVRAPLYGLAAALALAACGGGGGGGTGGGGILPGPTPTPTVRPTATPSMAPQNFFPIDGKTAYETGTSSGSASTSLAVLGTPLVDTTCSAVVNPVFGEYVVTAAAALVDYATINAYNASHNGANPLLVITKDASGNVFVVGIATYGQSRTPAVTCVAPYLWVRAQMKSGDSWNYTDALGNVATASVQSVQPSQTVTLQCGSCSANGQQATYTNVATIVYGSATPYTMVWAGGVGPVQTTNTAALSGAPLGVGATWTAFAVTISPTSP